MESSKNGHIKSDSLESTKN